MLRPGPLQELPLDLFLHNPNLLHPMPFKSNKRPLSPSAPILYSPAKRRILNEAGIFSPEKTHKTPVPASRGNQLSSARFADVLAGPDSPAAKLNFGPPKNQPSNATSSLMPDADDALTPRRVSSPSRALSPSCSRAMTPSRSVATSSRSSGNDFEEPDDSFDLHRSSSSSASDAAFIPRESLPYSDPHSIHYPGFLIYRDPHSVSPGPIQLSTSENINEEWKENLPPKKVRQSSSKLDDADSVVHSSLHPHHGASSTMPTPSRITTVLGAMRSTPRLSKDERREMRRLLEEEVDYAEHDDDSESSLS